MAVTLLGLSSETTPNLVQVSCPEGRRYVLLGGLSVVKGEGAGSVWHNVWLGLDVT